MGHNRSGVRFKQRKNRHKREQARLEKKAEANASQSEAPKAPAK